jgi:hypothetical protein
MNQPLLSFGTRPHEHFNSLWHRKRSRGVPTVTLWGREASAAAGVHNSSCSTKHLECRPTNGAGLEFMSAFSYTGNLENTRRCLMAYTIAIGHGYDQLLERSLARVDLPELGNDPARHLLAYTPSARSGQPARTLGWV